MKRSRKQRRDWENEANKSACGHCHNYRIDVYRMRKISEKAENTEENKYGADALECLTSENYAYTAEYRDKETGVHYFYTYKGGLTVRINADGTPYVD